MADSLYQAKDFNRSAKEYTAAFKANGWKGVVNDRYNAARSWALTATPDSAFFQLDRITSRANYSNYEQISKDADLSSLHGDARWKPLLEKIKANKEKAESTLALHKSLRATLEQVYEEDQNYRQQIKEIEGKYGADSKEMKAHWKLIGQKDSTNLLKVKEILDQYGWLGADVVGAKGNVVLFLVVQHADQVTQEKYLPMMREAVKNGKADKGGLALLEDRLALRQGKKQIYGSQVGYDSETKTYYVSPLADPDQVDQRRAAMGLGPLAEYVKNWQINWDVAQYLKDLPQVEKKYRRTNNH